MIRIPPDIWLDTITYVRLLEHGKHDEIAEFAVGYIKDYLSKLDAATPVEQMLAIQMLWQHLRVSRLSLIASNPTNTDLEMFKALQPAVEAAMNTSRRQALAWQQLKTPRPVQFIKGGQVNVAEQQVVQQGDARHLPTGEADGAPSLPAVSGGTSFIGGVSQEEQALGELNRPEDC